MSYPGVLYVEDDFPSRMVMQILLVDSMQLANVAIWEDSSDFEVKMSQLTFLPDIVFLDIHMKPIDGFAMLKILRATPEFADKPIVALTASVMNEEISQLKDAGFNGVIPKPIVLDTFPDTLEQLLRGEEVWRVIQ